MENWLGSSLNQIQGRTTVRESYSCALEQRPLVQALYPGQVGYFTCSMKSPSEALVGDTFHAKDRPVESLGEVQAPKPMVFAGFYPQGRHEFSQLLRGHPYMTSTLRGGGG